MSKYFLIGVGGFLGANARYLIGVWADTQYGGSFPAGTFLINVTGSFLLALFMVIATERVPISPEWRFLIGVGFFGAYTTFSTFSVETWRLVDDGAWLLGLGNALGSVLLGFAGAWLGTILARWIW